MFTFPVIDVSDAVIKVAYFFHQKLNIQKLQQLLYFLNASYLVKTGRSLFKTKITMPSAYHVVMPKVAKTFNTQSKIDKADHINKATRLSKTEFNYINKTVYDLLKFRSSFLKAILGLNHSYYSYFYNFYRTETVTIDMLFGAFKKPKMQIWNYFHDMHLADEIIQASHDYHEANPKKYRSINNDYLQDLMFFLNVIYLLKHGHTLFGYSFKIDKYGEKIERIDDELTNDNKW